MRRSSSLEGRIPRFKASVKPGLAQETGLGSKREVEEFRIHPNTIKELPTGQAVLITKLPKSTSTIVQITPPNDHGHPTQR
jgi:hypothetical protein